MHLPGVENKGSSLGQRTSDVAVNREKYMNPHPRMNTHTATQTYKDRKVIELDGERGVVGWILSAEWTGRCSCTQGMGLFDRDEGGR